MGFRLLIKTLISALAIAGVSELGKKSMPIATLLAALPLSSIMAMLWLYYDTRDGEKISQLSTGIFWALLPSFIFLLSLPLLLKNGVRFPVAMPLSCALMVVGYGIYVWILKQSGVQF